MTADGSVMKPTRAADGNGAAEPTLATRLAEKICAFRLEDMTARALSEARTAIIDTIGCTLAGIPEPCAQILLETPGVADAPGPALVFGTSHRTSALDATLINGTASHALDYDDVSGVHGRAPLGTRDGAHLCARRAAEGFGQAGARGLHHRRRDGGAAVARGQFPSLRQGLAPDRHARHVRSGGSRRPSSRARRRAHGQGAGARRLVLDAASRPTSAP